MNCGSVKIILGQITGIIISRYFVILVCCRIPKIIKIDYGFGIFLEIPRYEVLDNSLPERFIFRIYRL